MLLGMALARIQLEERVGVTDPLAEAKGWMKRASVTGIEGPVQSLSCAFLAMWRA